MKRIYVDMDGVLADFDAGKNKLSQEVIDEVGGAIARIENYFRDLPLIPHAKEAVKFLLQNFDVYVLSTPPWSNPSAWMDKRLWLEEHFPELKKRLILSHNKSLLMGDYLIDDREVHGAADFHGEHILFGSEKFPDWPSVIQYLKEKEQLL